MLLFFYRSVSGTYRRAEQQQFLADSTTDTICFGGDQNDPQTRYVMQERQGFDKAYLSVSLTLYVDCIREQMLGTLQQATHILCTIPPSSQDNLVSSIYHI